MTNTKRPNILLIYADQMRADSMSCAGNPVIKTPQLDRLAVEGARFDQAYTAFPLCCPFRASIMTGKYPHANGMGANHYPIPLDQEFLAQILADNGYQTGYIGKWHLNGGTKYSYVAPEERLGFQRFIGFSRGHYYFDPLFYRDNDPTPRTSRRYEPDFQTDHAIEIMSDALEDDDKPFFAMICYGLPHPPLDMPDYYNELYSPDEVPVRDNTPDDPVKRKRARKFLAGYYGLIANVDHNVGRLLDWLDARDIVDDTLVIFLSDHGDMAGEHGHYSKKTYYEGSARVPFLVRYPRRFPARQAIASVVDPSVDIMPTLLDIAEIETPDVVQGVSLASVLNGKADAARDAVFYEICMEKEGPEKFPIPERGVRTTEWLYVRTEEGAIALHDLKNDPLEMNNLANAPEHAAKQAELDAMLADHMRATDDDWSIEKVFPPPNFQTHEEAGAFIKALKEKAVVEP